MRLWSMRVLGPVLKLRKYLRKEDRQEGEGVTDAVS